MFGGNRTVDRTFTIEDRRAELTNEHFPCDVPVVDKQAGSLAQVNKI